MKNKYQDQKIKIDHDVHMPSRQNVAGLADALRRCKVGDSFVVKTTNRNTFYVTAMRLNMKVAIRKEGKGLRVWRIK